MGIGFAVPKVLTSDGILRRGVEVIAAEADALRLMGERLDSDFVDACRTIYSAAGRIVITGMGKSGHVARKWAATMAATGTPAIYVHPAEAAHGDLGMLIPGDVLLVISNSGNTGELRPFLRYAKSINVDIIGVASQRESLVMQQATVKLCYPAVREACPANVAPTTSTTLQIALGDAIALAVMDMRGFCLERMKNLHPGGTLGTRMTSVREVMTRSDLPLIAEDADMNEVVDAMTSSGLGIAGVIDMAGRLKGVITDGDLRRNIHQLHGAEAASVMNKAPVIVEPQMLVDEVLRILNTNEITAAFVIEPDAAVNNRVPIGVIHVHDLLRLGLG
ncbi:KpsF/GutQ family sugar-phosphate isomerase [Sphingomonas kaistensis]|uniref:KpsF/GutQ family sugar-phosphate isomerase n=1 Tax=Sphingomonas kaistensis TaxID=298708 RepID=A0ABZ2G0A0_9SPHN